MKDKKINRGIDTSAAFDLSSTDEGIVVDVRSVEEYLEKHIKNAISIPLDQIESRINELPSDKKIIFVCNTGNKRCTKAYEIVAKNGFDITDLYKINGGTKGWIENGYPTDSTLNSDK
tara:strand:- start:89 stop:442 length:354 start_codon:yes stop_codon:yes gene_type:complete